VLRYDLPTPDGGYAERFWSHRTVPVLDEQGDVVLLLHRADDITDYVRHRDEAGWDAVRGRQVPELVHPAEADFFSLTRELAQGHAELLASSERERHTAASLAGLATTVAALSAAESRAELLRQMFRHGRRALQADVLAVALLDRVAATWRSSTPGTATAPTRSSAGWSPTSPTTSRSWRSASAVAPRRHPQGERLARARGRRTCLTAGPCRHRRPGHR
jgi:hypothetical protein